MSSTSSRYRCRCCGSASYQRLTHRTAAGVMGYSGMHRCSGCSLTFASLPEWQDGAGADGDPPASGAGRALHPSPHPSRHRAPHNA